MSEFVLYGLVAIGLVVLVLQFLLLQRAGRKDETVEPGFRTIEGGLERLERELRQELARVRQEAASAARGDREEQAQALDRLAKTLSAQVGQLGAEIELTGQGEAVHGAVVVLAKEDLVDIGGEDLLLADLALEDLRQSLRGQAGAGLRRFAAREQQGAIVGMDVVEVAPAYDVSEITALAAATVIWDYLGLVGSAKKA